MSRPTRLHLGLWSRMAVAGLLVGLGQLVVLALEFAFVAFGAVLLIAALERFLVAFFVLSLLLTALFVCWLAVATIVRWIVPSRPLSDRIAHDGVADAVERTGDAFLAARSLERWPTVLAALVGTTVTTFTAVGAVETVAWRSVVDPVAAGVAVGVVVVLAHLAWVCYREWTGDAAALEDLADAARIVDRPDDDLERWRSTVQARIDRLARQADVPSPTVRLGLSPTPMAATAGYRPANSTIVVSSGLLETLDEDELEAVLAHELAHLQNRDAAVVTALSTPAAYAVALIDRHDAHPIVAVPAGLVIVLVRWCVAVVTRYREYVADRGAVAITGDPAALASALEKLDVELERRPSRDLRNHRSTAAFSIVPPPWEEHRFFDRTRRFVARTLFGTHPSTEKRIDRLRASIGD